MRYSKDMYMTETPQVDEVYQATTSEAKQTYNGTVNTLQTAASIVVSIAIALAIMWVWSMISMIRLNAKFRDFSREYIEAQKSKVGSTAAKVVTIDPAAQATQDATKERIVFMLVVSAALIVGALVMLYFAYR